MSKDIILESTVVVFHYQSGNEDPEYTGLHAQEAMKKAGITYEKAVPQTMGDCWDFWNCANIPDNLPKCFTVTKRDPMEHVGWGLSEGNAKELLNNLI